MSANKRNSFLCLIIILISGSIMEVFSGEDESTKPHHKKEPRLCYETNCHSHLKSHYCPDDHFEKTWAYCRGIFGRKETCCPYAILPYFQGASGNQPPSVSEIPFIQVQ